MTIMSNKIILESTAGGSEPLNNLLSKTFKAKNYRGNNKWQPHFSDTPLKIKMEHNYGGLVQIMFLHIHTHVPTNTHIPLHIYVI